MININIGVLGHVDSGKTSLVKALSEIVSTAALDKSPQSQERGITQDLGFSSFTGVRESDNKTLQVTLVDCPGHASLIKTIIGGAQIIDHMILVIDAVKLIQTQTAECIVIGEIMASTNVSIVLNKTDLIKDNKKLNVIIDKLRNVFEKTKFGKDVPILCVSANPGGSSDNLTINNNNNNNVAKLPEPIGIDKLAYHLINNIIIPERNLEEKEFQCSIDHCFKISGMGTILTGTVTSGRISVGDAIELPSLKLTKKVKSIQRFKTSVLYAIQGDRIGICVTQLDDTLMERGLACSPGSMKAYTSVIVHMNKVRYYKGEVKNQSKFHISVGHTTVLGQIELFGEINDSNNNKKKKEDGDEKKNKNNKNNTFSLDNEYMYLDKMPDSNDSCYGVITFDKPILCNDNSIIIGSRLDSNTKSNSCRIAFSGHILCDIPFQTIEEKSKLKIIQLKSKTGRIDKMLGENKLLAKDLFSKEGSLTPFLGLKIELENGQIGIIDSSFGQGNKFKVLFTEKIRKDEIIKKTFILPMKKYIHKIGKDKKIYQP